MEYRMCLIYLLKDNYVTTTTFRGYRIANYIHCQSVVILVSILYTDLECCIYDIVLFVQCMASQGGYACGFTLDENLDFIHVGNL